MVDNVELRTKLSAFAAKHGFRGKGPLSVALVITDRAGREGLPLDSDRLVTPRGGQVRGLGRGPVQKVLLRHGIRRVLAKEGGRTSRGSLDNMREYVAFLNALGAQADLETVESFWVDRVREFFAARPLKMRLDAGMGVQAIVRDLIDQASKREMEATGRWYVGTLLQHLTGALIDCCLGAGRVAHHSSSSADSVSGRKADFEVDITAVHVTSAPGESVIGRCAENLKDGMRPVLVVRGRSVRTATDLASREGIDERVDVVAIEQAVAIAVFCLGGLTTEGRKAALNRIVDCYNEIVDKVETDPSLKIRIG